MSMSNLYQSITKLGHEVVKKTRINNAMGSVMLFIALISLPSIILFIITEQVILMVIALIPILYFLRAFDYIMKNNPALLRTEEHEEKMLQIQMGNMGEKDDELPEKAIDILEAETVEQKVLSPGRRRKK